ncbi:MAG: RDD family protein [Verrucomicrobiales bacterium]|nr:RDD family protein [Verrucomicrobiales bacterium]
MLHHLGCVAFRKQRRDATPAAAVLVGALLLSLLYLIPFVGVFSWAVFSMWGLGAAFLALLAKFRKETQLPVAPAVPPASAPSPAPAGGVPGTPPTTSAPADDGSTRMAVSLAAGSDTLAGPPEFAPGITPSPSAPSPSASASQAEGAPVRDRADNLPPSHPMTLPSPAQTELLALPRVGLKERILATALDWFLIEVVLHTLNLGGARATFIAGIAYFAGFWIWRQTTLGGILLRLNVVRLDGRPLDAPTALVRSLGAAFGTLALGLGYFWSAWDADRQGWHDKISGTVVVRTPATRPLV